MPTVNRIAFTLPHRLPVHSGWRLPWTCATRSLWAKPVVLMPANTPMMSASAQREIQLSLPKKRVKSSRPSTPGIRSQPR